MMESEAKPQTAEARTCRLCLEKNLKTVNIFHLKIDLKIMAYASVQVLADDGLPGEVCQKCLAKLNAAWQFKAQIEAADAKLRQVCRPASLEEFGLKQPKGADCEECNVIEYIFNNIIQTQDNAISKDEDKEELKKKPDRHKVSLGKEPKVHQCDTCGKTFNRREYLTQHIRIHTGEKPYRCHLCEKRFVNSGHLTTHMRTHTGEKPHRCAACPKAFSTRQELQKHTMVHNGDRPFVCKLCGKKFGSSSNLYSHLKHHTGEKNFTCENCGKAFYTKQELKQHQVIHTGEKAFLCEFCNKRFSQIAHLRRHAKLHKSEMQI